MIHEHRHLLDFGAMGFAALAAISLSLAALTLTIIATLLSIILGIIRVHDRIKYGPRGYRSGE